ncbi:hypothetical protein HYW76_00385 [Candidatus Pacearchaeota archaeon]|nr:hypothetical protein [Candidatus Pacearchaeota archaeon]
MKIEDHLRNINESLEVIKESIEKGIQNRQRNLSFNISVASVEMLEVFLHKNNLINPGTAIKHDWFSSERRANERLPFEFNNKLEIIKLLADIETKRNMLCYGKLQPVEIILSVLEDFNKLKEIFEREGLKWN